MPSPTAASLGKMRIAFGPGIRKVPSAEIDSTVKRVADILQINHLLDYKPGLLSGGQRQRVAMGRAIARDPALFLFDEPLSNLDAKLRIDMRAEIKLMHQRLGSTIVYVTHDRIEAMTLGDRIAVLKEGVVQQFGTPQQIYDKPANLFVAGFFGSPSMNFLHGRLLPPGTGSAFGLQINDGRITYLPLHGTAGDRRLASWHGSEVIPGIRPEHVLDASVSVPSGSADDYQPTLVECLVELTEPTGPDTLVVTRFNNARVTCRVHPRTFPVHGKHRVLAVDMSNALLFDPATEQRIG